MKIHQVVNSKIAGQFTNVFFCAACEFVGPLEEAIPHAVGNQFIVQKKPSKVKKSWLKNNETNSWNSNLGRTQDFR